MAEGGARHERHPPLGMILLVVNLVVLLLPVGGLLGLRLYQNALLRQTEAELVAQGAFVSAAYQAAYVEPLSPAQEAGLVEALQPPPPLDPHPPRLNALTDRVWPRAQPARAPKHAAEAEAIRVGGALRPLLHSAHRLTLAGIRVVDRSGIVVSSTSGDMGMSLAHRTEVSRALEGQDVRLLRERISDEPRPPLDSLSRGTPVRIFVAMPIKLRGEILGAVILSRTPMAMTKALYQSRGSLFIGGVLLLIAVAAVTALTTFTIARPMRALIRQSRRIARGEERHPVPIPSPGTQELAELSEAMSQMACALETRAQYIQAFAANVSHEFKTPLASMRGSIELLQDHLNEMDDTERARFLTILGDDVTRLDRLVKALLELARADMARPTGGACDAAQIVTAVAQLHRERGLPIKVNTPPGPAHALISPQTLEAIITNLLDNARRHGGEDITVEISLVKPGDGQPLTLTVRDNGPGVSQANRGKIFEAFFTTARSEGGTGLGLAISRTLARAHGGDLYLGESAQGAFFVLELTPSPTGHRAGASRLDGSAHELA